MREIKFRCWDKFNECYWYSDSYKSLGDFFSAMDLFITGGNELVYEQYTGLKDKNRKEIYEGDFIKDSGFMYEVRFGCYLIEPCEYTGFYMWRDNEAGMIGECDQQVIEVIGIIYENPELLK